MAVSEAEGGMGGFAAAVQGGLAGGGGGAAAWKEKEVEGAGV